MSVLTRISFAIKNYINKEGILHIVCARGLAVEVFPLWLCCSRFSKETDGICGLIREDQRARAEDNLYFPFY